MNNERPDHDGTGHDGTGSDGTHGARHRRRGVLTAAVAAAVLLAGGGGAYLAVTASGGSDGRTSSGATPPPLALDSPAADGATAYRTAGPLPDGPDAAPVYRAAGRVTEEQVRRLAEALGLDGEPVVRGASWTVGTAADGSGPVLRVAREAPGNWTFQRSAATGDDCGRKDTVCANAPADTGPVSEAAAEKAAAPVLAAVGQHRADLDAGQVLGARRAVNAEPEIGGLPTDGWTTGVIVGAGGEVVGGSGRVSAPVKGETYPVLDAERTLARLERAPAVPGGCASAVPLEGGAGACAAGSGRAAATVERAVFGLAARPVDGRDALVPSWLFDVREPGAADAVRVAYPAVDPAYLAAASPRPSGERAERDVAVTGYTAEGTELTVRFTGGVCAAYDARAREGSGKVTVTVTERSDPERVCVLIAKEYELPVRLDEPLGGRAVVGSDGERVPLARDGARLPAPDGGR
ncbi:hypothetical protein AB0E75_19865 [Streptomyces griseoviridis]|uniref:Membrane protein n=1 Tax=Streptomyces griseoviridis TaxID=45398 RepID=A0A918L928_STRGD|nr:hypothetical protein [Streptomyces niveoruber]GGS21618.1 membrane protein [Streptomyces niveoruber]